MIRSHGARRTLVSCLALALALGAPRVSAQTTEAAGAPAAPAPPESPAPVTPERDSTSVPTPTPPVTPPLPPVAPPPPVPPSPAEAPSAPSQTLPPAERPAHPGRIPAYVTGGIAVASLGIGAVLGILAAGDHADFVRHPTAEVADRGEARDLAADMFLGAAATFAVASAVLFLSHAPAPDPAVSHRAPAPLQLAIRPLVTSHVAGAGAVLRF